MYKRGRKLLCSVLYLCQSYFATPIFIRKNKRPESLFNLHHRTQNFKKFLKNFLNGSRKISNIFQEEEKIEKEEEFFKMETNKSVLVFTHSGFIRMSTAKLSWPLEDIKNYPSDCSKPNNCEMVPIDIINI